MDEQNRRMNYRYRCKIKEANYDIQLFNLEQEKIKILINTKNAYSDEYAEYSNIYTLIQFQEITNYYILFESIEEIFDDLIKTIQDKNFSIERNENTMNFKIQVMVNKKARVVNFILERTKIIDLSSQRDGQYYNTISTKNSEFYRNKNYQEKSKRNVAISDINELNTLLSDFKDRIAVLEQSQISQINKKETMPSENYTNNLMTSANSNINNVNDKLNQSLENILLRLQILEFESKNKDKTIEKLEKKLHYFESLENKVQYEENSNSNNINNNSNNIKTLRNVNNKNNMNNINKYPKYPIPNYSKAIKNKKTISNSLYHNEYNPFTHRNIRNKTGMTLSTDRLKKIKSQFISQEKLRNNSIFNNNDNATLHSQETEKYNNNDYNNNYNDKYSEQQTNPLNNDLRTNSTISNYSNAKDYNFQKYIQYKEKLRIPMVPRENIKKFVNSRIIFTKNELRLLKTKFTQGNKKIHAFFDLLYRASEDGDYEDVAKSKARHHERTLTLFYTYEGARFGAYVSRKPATSFIKGKIYKEVPGESFMVSLNNLKFFDIMPNKTCKDGEDVYLCFGRTFYLNTNGTNWVINTPREHFLKKKCTIGDKGSDYKNLDTELLVGVREDYHIKDVEIFEVSIEKDDDSIDEEYKKFNNKKKKK